MTLIGLLVFLIIAGLVFWVVRTLSGSFGIPQPVVSVIYVVLVIVAVLWLLQGFGLIHGGPAISIR
jgi:hypothetical protein